MKLKFFLPFILYLLASILVVTSAYAEGPYIVKVGGGNGGLVAPVGTITVPDEGIETVTITPIEGYHTISVIVDGVDKGALTSVNIPDDLDPYAKKHFIKTKFAINTYEVTASAGSGGTISPAAMKSVMHGKTAKYTITPDPGGKIMQVLVNGVPQTGFPSDAKKYKFAVPITEVTTIVAIFDAAEVDADGDGYTESQGDCNDADSMIHAGATDICGNGMDENCSGADLTCPIDPNTVDDDGDGFTENQGDCNDANAAVYPAAAEICEDGTDQDCSGSDAACPAGNSGLGGQWLISHGGQVPVSVAVGQSGSSFSASWTEPGESVGDQTTHQLNGTINGTSVTYTLEYSDLYDPNGWSGSYTFTGIYDLVADTVTGIAVGADDEISYYEMEVVWQKIQSASPEPSHLLGNWALNLQQTFWGSRTSELPLYVGSTLEIDSSIYRKILIRNGIVDEDSSVTYSLSQNIMTLSGAGDVECYLSANLDKLIVIHSDGDVEVWDRL